MEQALLTWHESSAALGLSFGQSSGSTMLPAEEDPGDEEVVTVRTVVSCASWPKALSNALT